MKQYSLKCSKWLTSNGLTLNVQKTHSVDFSKIKSQNDQITLKLGNKILQNRSETKHFAITLPNN